VIERRKHHRYLVQLPVEYWKTEDAAREGLVFNVSETGLLIYSTEDMAIGTELAIKVYYSVEDNFETILSLVKIIWKDVQQEGFRQGYKYGLEFIRMSPQDREKLKQRIILRQRSRIETKRDVNGRPIGLDRPTSAQS